MRLSTHLHFEGQCEEAFRFYSELLGGKITFMARFSDTPAALEVPESYRPKIMHATMELGGGLVMGADAPPGRYEKPQGFAVALHYKDVAEAERIFRALAEGGDVRMPFMKTFWSPGFGMVTDRFGTPWMVNCEE